MSSFPSPIIHTKGQIIGYARVSTGIQDTQAQIDELKHAGCVKIFMENASARDDTRPELQKMFDYIREGDLVLVTKLDRFCRNIKQFWALIKLVEDKGVAIRSLDGILDTTSPHSVAMTSIAATFANLEREIISTRRSEAMQRARAAGRRFGRKCKLSTPAQIEEVLRRYYVQEESPYKIAELLGVGRATVRRLLDSHPIPAYAKHRRHPDDPAPTDPQTPPKQPVDDSKHLTQTLTPPITSTSEESRADAFDLDKFL